MAGSSSQATVANFVKNYSHLPSWAQPGGTNQLSAVSPNPNASGGNAMGQGLSPNQAIQQQHAQAAAAKSNAQALKQQQRNQAQQVKQQQKQQAAAQKQAQQQSQQFAQTSANIGLGLGVAGSNAATSVSQLATGVQQWAASWPTPGGIGLLLLVLFILLWALIPVDTEGYTRLQLLWFTVMGRTVLQGSQSVKNAETVAMLSNTTSPTLGVTSLAQNVQGTTQDFSVSPALGTLDNSGLNTVTM